MVPVARISHDNGQTFGDILKITANPFGDVLKVPPNAVLILDDVEQRDQDLALFYLFNPEYNPEANTLKYDITAENATTTTTSINLPDEFGQSTLVIGDDGGDKMYCDRS